MKRYPNTTCSKCGSPVYRRPSDIAKTANSYCTNCHDFKQAVNAVKAVHHNTYEDYIRKWQRGDVDGNRGRTAISRHVRRYLFDKYNNKCCKCGWSEVNSTTQLVPLEINHINGNSQDTTEDNLELLCPNCHSLTPTYRSLNKGKGRKR